MRDKDTVLTKPTPHEQNHELFKIICGLSWVKVKAFCEVLKQNELGHLAKLIRLEELKNAPYVTQPVKN